MRLVAKTMQVASVKDSKLIGRDMVFYSVIKEIRMIDYFAFKIPVFKCDWVENKIALGYTNLDSLISNLVKLVINPILLSCLLRSNKSFMYLIN